jgi:hypothetical protein
VQLVAMVPMIIQWWRHNFVRLVVYDMWSIIINDCELLYHIWDGQGM